MRKLPLFRIVIHHNIYIRSDGISRMAKVIIDNNEFEVVDGEHFVEQAENCGVPFGCSEGICGTCKCRVLDGANNLSEKTQEEIDFGLDSDERLLCQVRAKSGKIKFKFM